MSHINIKNSQCLICEQPCCKHCKCPGYLECDHAASAPCQRNRYNRRLVCNTCERHKLDEKKRLDLFRTKVTGIQPMETLAASYYGPQSNETNINMNQQYFPDYNQGYMGQVTDPFDPSPPPVNNIPKEEEQPPLPLDLMSRSDTVHINISNNPNPISLVPINKDVDTLAYLRSYLENKIPSHLNSFYFLDINGKPIPKLDEIKISASQIIVNREWKHHTFGINLIRSHIFVDMDEGKMEIPIYSKRKHHEAIKDDDEENRDINRNRLDELFFSSSIEVQQKLALGVFDRYHYSMPQPLNNPVPSADSFDDKSFHERNDMFIHDNKTLGTYFYDSSQLYDHDRI